MIFVAWFLVLNVFFVGPAWMKIKNICNTARFDGKCYFASISPMNWFDGVDYCKTQGAEIVKFKTKYEEDYYYSKTGHDSSLWIGYHGHNYQGDKFVWNDGSADTYNRLSEKNANKGLSAGLCTLLPNPNPTSWERRNCSEIHPVVCSQPGIELITVKSCTTETGGGLVRTCLYKSLHA